MVSYYYILNEFVSRIKKEDQNLFEKITRNFLTDESYFKFSMLIQVFVSAFFLIINMISELVLAVSLTILINSYFISIHLSFFRLINCMRKDLKALHSKKKTI
jgi:hypothetical protein